MTTIYEQLIIGSGFGGLGMAIQLKKAGRHNFLVLEKSDSVGGTWRDNTYPGAACDVKNLEKRRQLIPNYQIGCNRILLANDWYASMDVKPERQQTYICKLQQQLDKTVWSSGCSSWYLTADGRNVVNWFGFTFSYRWMTWRVQVDDYEWVEESA